MTKLLSSSDITQSHIQCLKAAKSSTLNNLKRENVESSKSFTIVIPVSLSEEQERLGRLLKQLIHFIPDPVKSEDAAEKRSKVFNKKRPNSSKGQGLKHPIFPSYHEVVVDFNKNFLCPICWMQFEDKAEQFRHLGSHFKSARSVKDYKACFNPTVEVTRNEFETAEAAKTVKISIIL